MPSASTLKTVAWTQAVIAAVSRVPQARMVVFGN